jgi:transcription antitermination factor NusG
MLQPDVKWFVVMTEPRAEAAAARDLRRRGYKTLFLHTCEWVKASRTRSRLVKRPYLPGYIFVGLTPDQFEGGKPLLHNASTAQGVSALVRAPGGQPLPVPHAAMELLTWNADPSGAIHDGKPKPKFAGKKGDLVRLGDTTPYFGFLAEIEQVDPTGKITILLEAFGRKVPTSIEPEDVAELIPTSSAS